MYTRILLNTSIMSSKVQRHSQRTLANVSLAMRTRMNSCLHGEVCWKSMILDIMNGCLKCLMSGKDGPWLMIDIYFVLTS
uniref:Uncharacterized protein n=1 Tax=Arundo donax TaxID=35708 RepID=A0A0A9D9H2_ARUDO